VVEEARERVAKSLGSDPRRITFLSGATEANHAGLRALAHEANLRGKRTILANPLEHPSVLGCLRQLEREGFFVLWSPLSDFMTAKPGALLEAMQTHPDLGFAVCMAANNETGALQPWETWMRDAERVDLPIHVDGTQLWGKWSSAPDLPRRGNWVGSGHKLGALSGVGVLHSSGVSLEGWLGDGPQERSRRGGTENLLGILSLGAAVEHFSASNGHEFATMIAGEFESIPGVRLTVPPAQRLPNTVHVRLPVRADLVVQRLDLQGFAVSSGSACSSGSVKPSSVLLAMGWSAEDARRGLRISSGWTNTQDDTQALIEALRAILADLT